MMTSLFTIAAILLITVVVVGLSVGTIGDGVVADKQITGTDIQASHNNFFNIQNYLF